MKNISRRFFLKMIGVISAFTVGAAVFTRSVLWPKRKEIYEEYVSVNTQEKFGSLSDYELEYLYAFSELLFPPSGEKQKNVLYGVVRRWVNDRTKLDGYLTHYKNGVTAINIISKSKGYGTPFSEMKFTDRFEIMNSISAKRPTSNDHPVEVVRYMLNSIFNRNIYRNIYYLNFLRKDLIKGIYSSQLGWQLVGYDTWPGIAGDPLEYTTAPPVIGKEII